MADTIQVVLWALGQQCPLRRGDDWVKPATAIKTLSDCRTYSRLRVREGRGFGVFGDVCVTSVTSALPGKKSHYEYPSGGFVLSSQFSSIGGLQSLHRLCGDCPANIDIGGIAGCVGSFHQALYSKELQEQLDRLIDRLGIASKLDAVFPFTRLHWFRFWVQSPIPIDGLAPLHELLEAVYDEDDQEIRSSGKPSFGGQHADLNTFVKALACSITARIPLHVDLRPPGHTDLGWCTIFSHCSRCKAAAPVERWKRKYRDEEIECAICGAKYSPAKTHSAERSNWNLKELRDELGQQEFEKFASRCLVAQGASEVEAGRIVQEHEEWDRARKEKWAEQEETAKRHQQFVKLVIYSGLKNVGSPDEEEGIWLFSATDIEEIIRRCDQYGGEVLYLSHVSESGDQDEFFRISRLVSARQALQKLRDKGMNEKFSVNLRIPKEVVERWRQQQGAQPDGIS